MTAFHFFQLHTRNRSLHVAPSEKVRYLTLDLLKSFILSTIRKKGDNERDFKSYIIGEILDLPKPTATEYVIRHFWYICAGFSFMLQIIKASQSIKIIRIRNFPIFNVFVQFLDHLWRLFILSKLSLHTGPSENVRYLTLDLLKSFFLQTIQKRTTIKESLNLWL